MDISLNHETKIFEAQQKLTWINLSPDTLYEMRFYMYINAFKNMESTFLKSSRYIFGQDLTKRKKDTWGWMDVKKIIDESQNDLTQNARYIQPSDNNTKDESILQVDIPSGILPGDTLILNITYEAKMPKTIARTGYGEGNFFMFVHWFPQACVYIQDKDGVWKWNSHQAHRRTEYFADFGVYDVRITAWDKFTLGATGCLISEIDNEDGTKTWTYHAEDVIDFAWSVYPGYEVWEDQWEHVHIKLLIPPEHCGHAQRLIDAVKYGLQYFDEHVGTYPYTYLTMIDPPMKGLRGGFMEYPTFITGGSFYGWPKSIRSIESLMIHEFGHQFFMGIVANNEKEEAWLDEGFVTFYEDCVMEYGYGEEASLFNVFGYCANNSAFTRNEFCSMANPAGNIINQPGYETTGDQRTIIYSKSATVFQTIKRLVGEQAFDNMVRDYYETWKFKHPKTKDFLKIALKHLSSDAQNQYGLNLERFLDDCLNTTKLVDAEVSDILTKPLKSDHGWFGQNENRQFKEGHNHEIFLSEVTLTHLEEMRIPYELKIRFANGTFLDTLWNSKNATETLQIIRDSPIESVCLDPERKIYLDMNFNNNCLSTSDSKTGFIKYAAKGTNWFQHILNLASSLL